jgi:tRNA U34 2-thiouridine synthase MnmA/TrmU
VNATVSIHAYAWLLHGYNFFQNFLLDGFRSAVTEYRRGLSPALDMLYNKHLTFGSVLDYVHKQVGADALATDNYARLVVGEAPIGGFQHLFGRSVDVTVTVISMYVFMQSLANFK